MSTNDQEKKKEEAQPVKPIVETPRIIPTVPLKDTEQLNEGVDPKTENKNVI